MKKECEFSLLRALRTQINGTPLYGQELIIHNTDRSEHRTSGIEIHDKGSIYLPLATRAIIASGTTGSGKEGICED
jgi:hypothetical protein